MKKAFVTLFPPFDVAHLYKDVGMITRYMSSYHGYKGYILSNRNVEFDDKIFPNISSVKINKTGKFKESIVSSSSYSVYEILKNSS
ncbi:hypothetical protein KVP08_014480 [Shewanella putrefaciens]|nr:hypothetical protein KVP08_014480 [Shewanella putrefaciens]